MRNSSFIITRPSLATGPVIFSSPHSGRAYSDSFISASVLDRAQLRSSEDAFVDQLYSEAPALGAPLIAAQTPRAFVDFNRAPDEMDPALIEGARRVAHNARISSGLGVIPRVVAGGRAIYSGKLSIGEAERRIADHWHPYHHALRALIEETHHTFGQAVLLDCHSMPHEAIEHLGRGSAKRPEVVLGDRLGASAAEDLVDRLESAFKAQGFVVGRNSPFAGAFISQSYGRPSSGRHVIQIELDRSLYMDEGRILPLPGFTQFKDRITQVMRRFLGEMRRDRLQIAAE